MQTRRIGWKERLCVFSFQLPLVTVREASVCVCVCVAWNYCAVTIDALVEWVTQALANGEMAAHSQQEQE